jgi:hypothetical protein
MQSVIMTTTIEIDRDGVDILHSHAYPCICINCAYFVNKKREVHEKHQFSDQITSL